MATGKASHAMLGAYVVDDQSASSGASFSVGAKIDKLMPNSPALKAGLKVGDIITKVNGKTIESASDLTATIRLLAAGSKATLEIQRAGQAMTINVTLGDAVNLK
jgi:putative serine protease PepD